MSERRRNIRENQEIFFQFIDKIHVKVAQVMSIKSELAKEYDSNSKRKSTLNKQEMKKEGINLIEQIKKDFKEINQFKNQIDFNKERHNLLPIKKLVNELKKWFETIEKNNPISSDIALTDTTNHLRNSQIKLPNSEFSTDIIENDYFFSSKRFDVRLLHSDIVQKEVLTKLKQQTKREQKQLKFKQLNFVEGENKSKKRRGRNRKIDEDKENFNTNAFSNHSQIDNIPNQILKSCNELNNSYFVNLSESKLGPYYDPSIKKSTDKRANSSDIKIRIIQDNELFDSNLFPKNLFEDFRAYIDQNKTELVSILDWE